MFKHMSLRIKLLATFTLLALFLGAVGLLNFKGIKQVFETFDHIAEVNLPNASTLGDMRFAISEIDRDILNLALADSSKEIQGKLIADYKQAVADYEKSSKIYEGIPFVPGEAERYDKVSAAFKDYLESTRRYVELSRSSASRSSSLLFDNYQTDIAPKRQLLDTSIHELINFQNSQAEIKGDEADKVAYFYTQLSIWLVAAGFLAAIGLGALISWSLSKTLNNIAEITVQSTNEVNLATSQLSAASHGLSGASTQVASSLQETAASIEELNAMVKQSAENANEAATSSNQGRDLAAKMDADMKTLLESLLEMSEKSKQIGEIVTLIDDMAFQTNILALNASVEAARAGDAGKGFAVVADAVRSLAQKSASSSKSIATLIHASLESVTKSTRIAEDSHRSLSAIVEVVRKIAKLNDELAASSREQSQALSQITKAMSEIDQATQQNAAASEQIAASSEEMSAQAESMMGVVQTLNIIVRGLAESRSVLH